VKKILQRKPKIISNLVQDITQPQIVTVEVHNTSQSPALVADAEVIPARDQSAYNPALANNTTSTEVAKINKNNCTNINNVNIDTADEEYYNSIDKDHQTGVESQPPRPFHVGLNYCTKNFNPFLSDSKTIELTSKPEKILDNSSIGLVRDLETFNTDKVLNQEDSEKDQIIAEGYLPITTNKAEDKMEIQMDADLYDTWGDLSQTMDVISQPMDDMRMVNPFVAEGIPLENAMMQTVSTSTPPTQEQQPIINPEGSTTENTVPAENNLLEMIINDSIGLDTVAEACNATQPELNFMASLDDIQVAMDEMDPEWVASIMDEVQNEEYSTLNIADISTPTENTRASPTVPIAENEEVVVTSEQKRKGPGRPKKPRTVERVVKPRGRPAKLPLENENLTTDHHNYSNDGAFKSSTSSVEKRYRRMRDLNNSASRRCRQKRKNKMNSAFEELKQEEERNKELQMRVRVLEDQVQALKARFINKIANPIKDPRALAIQNASFEWNSEQLERLVDVEASRHLGM
jgi:hypothetical protein